MTKSPKSPRFRSDAGTLLLLVILASGFGLWASRDAVFHWLDRTFSNRPLNSAKSWHYHLTRLDLDTILKSNADLVVTEYSANVGENRAWTREEVEKMKRKPDGSKRLVLAYLSIGEAESYRFYWKPEWKGQAVPGWYVAENCAWPRNYMVRFWLDGWKDIIFRGPDSFLKRIVDAGFDGVYLDRIDVFWELEKERPSAREDMVQFVREIAEAGRRMKPGFLVIAQNAEDLLSDQSYRDIIDGLGKEDLLYGHSGTNTPNPEKDVTESRTLIRELQDDEKPVFAVEYVTDPKLVADARSRLESLGYVPLIAHRSLDGRPPGEARPPSTIKYGTPEWIKEKCQDKPHW
ncbi:MAG: MJ1477/TM1410 family putative glycoside hydrolase [Hyphomicrobiaceae bacterium]